jgi:hypothetical protein
MGTDGAAPGAANGAGRASMNPNVPNYTTRDSYQVEQAMLANPVGGSAQGGRDSQAYGAG